MATASPATNEQTNGRDIVVIGASAGGLLPVKQLVEQLPRDLPAALFLVRHLHPDAESNLAMILNRARTLRCKDAEDGEHIEHGVLYVGPPDRHLIVKHGHVRVTRGPRENHWRPSVDVLFRSAAVAYGTRVIGIVLSGMLDDGTRGLGAVKACGGTTIAQDPAEAEFPDMPQSALANGTVDFTLPMTEMSRQIQRLVRQAAAAPLPVPSALEREVRVAEMGASVTDPETQTGTLSVWQCPECGGPMYKHMGEGEAQYRCLVGHAWGDLSLLAASDERLENTLWAAVHQFEQRNNVLRKMAGQHRRLGQERSSIHYETLAKEANEHARVLRELLMRDA